MPPLDDEASKKAIYDWISQFHSELDQKSYYQLLDVERIADDTAVSRAYYRMVARFHPDNYGDNLLPPDIRAKLVTLYSRLVEGYTVLRDPAKRAQYAKMLEQGKLRWSLDDERAQKRDPEAEILNPNARRFYQLGKQALRVNDARSAIMNLKLALSCEPGSEAIQKELARAESMAKGKG
jgi:curved DNA-binding protein CbpA